jgi:hypothetical protein
MSFSKVRARCIQKLTFVASSVRTAKGAIICFALEPRSMTMPRPGAGAVGAVFTVSSAVRLPVAGRLEGVKVVQLIGQVDKYRRGDDRSPQSITVTDS